MKVLSGLFCLLLVTLCNSLIGDYTVTINNNSKKVNITQIKLDNPTSMGCKNGITIDNPAQGKTTKTVTCDNSYAAPNNTYMMSDLTIEGTVLPPRIQGSFNQILTLLPARASNKIQALYTITNAGGNIEIDISDHELMVSGDGYDLTGMQSGHVNMTATLKRIELFGAGDNARLIYPIVQPGLDDQWIKDFEADVSLKEDKAADSSKKLITLYNNSAGSISYYLMCMLPSIPFPVRTGNETYLGPEGKKFLLHGKDFCAIHVLLSQNSVSYGSFSFNYSAVADGDEIDILSVNPLQVNKNGKSFAVKVKN